MLVLKLGMLVCELYFNLSLLKSNAYKLCVQNSEHAASTIGGMLDLLQGNALSFVVKPLLFRTLY